VVCITLGYSTTYLAGVLGLATIILGYFGGALDADQRRQLTRMTYGTLCFAIFFSFIGTVLGGLWADDSWGRFWGWDPKENGALMIVIWNAIVLHARWGKMIGELGLAALAVIGNIVVTWSWFGVNEMGVGLHSYGFTEGRRFWVGAFMLSQLAIVMLAYLEPYIRKALAPTAGRGA
jgi:ABC-type transport system involved in cytochrome c biogenesis permease subunit